MNYKVLNEFSDAIEAKTGIDRANQTIYIPDYMREGKYLLYCLDGVTIVPQQINTVLLVATTKDERRTFAIDSKGFISERK